jgi:hypothetical protein
MAGWFGAHNANGLLQRPFDDEKQSHAHVQCQATGSTGGAATRYVQQKPIGRNHANSTFFILHVRFGTILARLWNRYLGSDLCRESVCRHSKKRAATHGNAIYAYQYTDILHLELFMDLPKTQSRLGFRSKKAILNK